MYYITFFIQPLKITSFVTKISKRNKIMVTKQFIEIDEETNITIKLNTLLTQVNTLDGLNYKSARYRIILMNDQILQQQLILPNIALKSHEIEQYIEHSLPKLFHIRQPLTFDYEITSNNEQNIFVTVYGLEQDLLQFYLTIFTGYQLNFVGITITLVEKNIPQQSMDKDFEQISFSKHINGINLLPWRAQLKKVTKAIFYRMVMSIIILLAIILFYLSWQVTQRYDKQVLQNKKNQVEINQYTNQLSLLVDLDSQIIKLQSSLVEMAKIQQRLHRHLANLIIVSRTLPDGMWLNSLSCHHNQVELKGDSFLYRDILSFVRQLHNQTAVQYVNVISVNKTENLLRFNVMVQFFAINDK